MPVTQSAKKALRKSKKHYKTNKESEKVLKSEIKKFRKLVADQKVEEAKKQLSIVYKKLDKAAKTNLIKKNKAARLKSQLSKQLNALQGKNA